MKFFKHFLYLMSVLIFLNGMAKPIFAHFQAMDGSYSGILHVNPDDSPIVGQDTTLVLFVAEPKNTFTFDTCICQLTSTGSNGFTVQTDLSTTGEAHVVFPSKGVYKTVFTGKDLKGASLFQFSYDIRVDREVSVVASTQNLGATNQNSPMFICMLLCVVLFVLIIYFLKDRIWKKQKKSR